MNSFLDNVAQSLYERYGDDISSLKIVLPNMRSRLFFQDSLSKIIDRPVWQPCYLSVDELMSSVANVQIADRIRTIVELYKVYSLHHIESFDSFYFWGEMLLNDFDQIDKYMINADILFANLRDLKEMGDDMSYMSEEQRRIISRFWDSFGEPAEYSEHQKRFITIWRTLAPVYHELRKRLADSGMAYQGMAYRLAAELLKDDRAGITEGERYAVIGFNALSVSERVLFDHLHTLHEADFFWDTDDYYLLDKNQEAGLFARENITRYPQPDYFRNRTDNFVKPKRITAISTASDSLQCKYASQFLENVIAEQKKPDKNTAIVLTDENLLVPLLYSLPEELKDINVTMGYPLRQTLVYSFVDRLLRLQDHARKRGQENVFYHSDVTGLLRHPYVLAAQKDIADSILEDMIRKSRVYVRQSQFVTGGLIEAVFSRKESWQETGSYIIDILSRIDMSAVPHNGNDDNEAALRREYFGMIAESVTKLTNSLEGCGVEITPSVFSALLRRMLQSLRIPFSGEPLQGVQVMGILETRNIDFDNVMIMSMNDDTFPGNPSASSSFVPYNLRVAYGLPTPQHHEGVYAYYFYRLLQRAERVDMVYCSKNDEKSSGEQSRYIYQLEYESPHNVIRKMGNIDVNLARPEKIVIPKTAEIMQNLNRFIDDGNTAASGGSHLPSLSPTAFYAYIECPLKFYFKSVVKLKGEDEIAEEIDMPMFGTILHSAMETLYKPLSGHYEPHEAITGLINSPEVVYAVNDAIKEVCFKGEHISETEFEGEILMIRDIVCRYINNNILPFDARQRRFKILDMEKQLTSTIPVKISGELKNIRFSGLADRVDLLDNGIVRIVDYKTGTPNTDFRSIEQLFGSERKERNAAVFQTFLYARMAYDMQQKGEFPGNDVCPALYFVRTMNKTDYSPALRMGNGEEVSGYAEFDVLFGGLIADAVAGLYNIDVPFIQCADNNVCKFCDYINICNR